MVTVSDEILEKLKESEVFMKELSIEYPESILAVLNLSTERFEQEAKIALAVKLYCYCQ